MLRVKKLIALIFALALLAVGLGGITAQKSAASNLLSPLNQNNSTVEFEDASIAEFYHTGTVLEIPQVYAKHKGQKYKTSSFLYLGEQVFTQNVVTLKKGEYRLEYAVNIEGKIYRKDYFFTVKDLGDHIFINQRNATVQANAQSPSYMQNQFTGVKITGSAEGATVVYDKIVDISDNTKHDPLIVFSLTPSIYGEEDYQQLTVTLTDVYDFTNKVSIQLYKGSWSQSVAFIKAGAANQLLTGLDKGAPRIEQRFGLGIKHSFRGLNQGFDTVTYYFDYKERAIYAANPGNTQYGNMVIDLDNPEHFSPTALWNGFTTGEVYLSISIEKVLVTPCSFMVLNVDGTDLSGEIIEDTLPPSIKILSGEYDIKNPPVAVVGKSYPIFEAKAFDAQDGDLTNQIEYKVYRDYGSTKAQSVPVTNGSFTPAQPGIYTVEYSVQDYSGNKGVKTYKVTAIEENIKPTINIEGEIPNQITVGKKYILPKFAVSGGSGNSVINTYLKDSSGNTVSRSDKEIFVQKAGQYVYVVEAQDYLGNKETKEFNITATVSQKPIFDIPAMPRYLLANKQVILPELVAYDYTQGQPAIADYVIKVKDGAGERQLNADRKYTPVINGTEGLVDITYQVFAKSGQSESVTIKQKVRNVYENGVLKLQRMFDCSDGLQYGEEYDSIKFTAQKDGEFTFINPILASRFYFEAEFEQGKGNLDSFSVILEDYEDADNKIVIKVINGGDKSYASVNGGAPKEITGRFASQGADRFKILYNDATMSVYDNSNQTLLGFLSGSGFKGFNARKLYVTVKLEGVKGATTIKLYDIAYQPLSDIGMDLIAPALELKGEIKTKVERGEKVVIPQAIALDVLDTAVEVEVSVKNNAGAEILKDSNIAYRPNSFTADSYGGYRVEYLVRDSSGSSTVYAYAVYVEDDEPPVITINGQVPQKGKVGQKITLPQATAADNLDQVTVKIAVVNPYGVMKTLNGNAFTPDLAGKYRITYYAFDNSGNLASQHFALEVSK